MRNLLLLLTIIGISVTAGCESESTFASDDFGRESVVDHSFPLDLSSAELVSIETHLAAIRSEEQGGSSLLDEDDYNCLWTSGTWAETGTWNWDDVDLTFTVGSDGTLKVEFITNVCEEPVGVVSTANAVYFPADTGCPTNYDLYGSVYWGYLPGLPWGWCWVFMVDYSWSQIPHSHGLTLLVDWAGAYNIGRSIPPITGICGWPLVGNPPQPFTVSGL